MEMHAHPSPPSRRASPLVRLIDAFDSIWLGIVLLVLIFVYAAVGSAVPVFRQAFELTEFQYFNHWVFAALIGLFCLALTVTTIRRIRVNLINAGVLMVHAGLLLLCAASVLYFSRKVEGDVWLEAPRIRVVSLDRARTDPANSVLDSFVAVPGEVWQQTMPMAGGNYRLEVADVEHQGLTTAARVKLRVRIGSEPEREVELRQSGGGHGEGSGPIQQINDKIALWLAAANVTDVFFDESTPVLLVRHEGHEEAFELPDLPYYRERFDPGVEPIVDTGGRPVRSERAWPIRPVERWRMPIPLDDLQRAASSDWPIRLIIDGYLPYARIDQKAVPGGDRVLPLARVRLAAGGHEDEDWLVAMLPERSILETAAGAWAEFNWIGEEESIDPRWTQSLTGRHLLEVVVRDRDVRRQYEISEGMKIDVEGTDYRLHVEQLQRSWPLMTAGFKNARTPIALVWVERGGAGTGGFQRSVLQRYPQLNQDRDRAGRKMSDTSPLVDDNIELYYTDASRDHFRIVAGSRMVPTLIHTAAGGTRTMTVLETGRPCGAGGGPSLTLAEYIERPRFVATPVVIPEAHRRPLSEVRRGQSMIRVHLASTSGDWSHRVWVPFSPYNTLHDQTEATTVTEVPGLGTVELVYGRTPRALPGRLALEQLQTDFYPGRRQPSGWTSYFRFEDPATGRVERRKAFLNNTAKIGEWTLFQSQASGDHKAWTVLGVGNREGVMSMLVGCCLITVGMIYAFAVKPALVRRRRARIEQAARDHERFGSGETPAGPQRRKSRAASMTALVLLAGAIGGGRSASPCVAGEMPAELQSLREIQSRIDVERLSSLVLQHRHRYSTVDSWARDAVKSIYGSRSFFGLEPVVAAAELMFNFSRYHAEPIIYVKDRGLLRDISADPVRLTDEERRRMLRTRRVSYDFLNLAPVRDRLAILSNDARKQKAMNRLVEAQTHYEALAGMFTVVPNPRGKSDAPWSSPAALRGEMIEAAGLTEEQARQVVELTRQWGEAWRARDVGRINAAIASLSDLLPSLAPAGVYPTPEQRRTEMLYRRWELIRWAWVCYIAAFFVSIFAVATRYGWVRWASVLLLAGATALHATDLGLRWNVLGRIPVANMYEAVVSSTLVGVALGLALELFMKKGVFAFSAALLGFFALSLPELLPDKVDNKLDTMMPILDDIMLRIHTVLIISSYAVITLAYAVANCYLFVAAFRDGVRLAQSALGAQIGAAACLVLAKLGWFDDASTPAFLFSMLASTVGGGILVVGLGSLLSRRGGGAPRSIIDAEAFPVRRNVLEEFDLSHRVLLYTAAVALFVGLVLGAVWADYSWGRPWGWDPKEVFALNTWLVYAILIHARFVTRRRALWTSVLSVVGFAAMQFNWWVVNFYIVGLHSYA